MESSAQVKLLGYWLKRHHAILTALGTAAGLLLWLRPDAWLVHVTALGCFVGLYALFNWDIRRRERNGDFL